MKVKVFEVGVRDGLQNESRTVSLEDKLFLAQGLIDAGVAEIELGAFVRSDRVPQMADTEQVYAAVKSGKLKLGKSRAWALVPNLKGLERAVASGASNIAVFTAATESFAERNIGMSIEKSLDVFREVIREAKKKKMKVRGYVSTAFGCPFEGKTPPKKAIDVCAKLLDLGVHELSVGDTIGVATPRGVIEVMKPLVRKFGEKKLAVHFHDTRGTALANTLMALDLGIHTVDASAGGLGGCPFAPGATGNLATEDLVYMLDGMGVKTGIDLEKLSRTSLAFTKKIGRPITSRYLQAFASAQSMTDPRKA